jgi:hypothetical protein
MQAQYLHCTYLDLSHRSVGTEEFNVVYGPQLVNVDARLVCDD